MIKVYSDSDTTLITLTPNLSAGWRESRILLLVLAIPVGAIAVSWFLAGAMLILPFAGLEMGALALAMHHVCRRAERREVLRIEPGYMTLERGRHHPEWVCRFQRPEVHLHVNHPERPLDMMELMLVDHRGRMPLGGFLNNDEREETRRALRQAGLMETSNRWWLRSA